MCDNQSVTRPKPNQYIAHLHCCRCRCRPRPRRLEGATPDAYHRRRVAHHPEPAAAGSAGAVAVASVFGFVYVW